VSQFCKSRPLFRRAGKPLVILVAAVIASGGCGRLQHSTDTKALDEAGMFNNSIEQLRQLGVSDVEVQQLLPVRQAGASDQTCIELVRIAHGRQQPFADGPAVANMIGAGLQEDSVLTLARLNQLRLFAGEAEAMRLAGLSDNVVLKVARRRAADQPILSSAKIAALRNAGLSEQEIMNELDRGATDAQADAIIAQRNAAAGGHSFVHQHGRRR
jgi:hypothetical protein